MEKIISLASSGGGRMASRLIRDIFLASYGNEILDKMEDASEILLPAPVEKIAFTTDSYTIKPIFFPGGDIGKLSVCGTVNDLLVKGACPLAISAGFMIEEGFLLEDLEKICRSMSLVLDRVGVKLVTGDTKVVGKGEVDGLFINTSGIGIMTKGMDISCAYACPGDDIIVSGTVADHGVAILNARESFGFSPSITSDTAPIVDVFNAIIDFSGKIHVMRDPTRGGIASVLNEIAVASKVIIEITEAAVPVKDNVRACCELLGLEPLYMANEGKMVIFCDPETTKGLLTAIRKVSPDAAVIGKVISRDDSQGRILPVRLITGIGSQRFLPLLDSDPLPRIC